MDTTGPAAALAIAVKDLRQRLRDRSVYLYGVVAPLGLAAVLSLTVGGGTPTITVRLAVADLDRGPVAQAFDALIDDLAEEGIVQWRPVADDSTARAAIDDGEVTTAVVLPAGLSQAVGTGRPAEVLVLGDPEAPIATSIARSIAESFVAEVATGQLAVVTLAQVDAAPPAAGEAAEVAQAAAATARSVGVVDDPVAGEVAGFGTFFAVGLSVFFLFFTVQFGVLGILQERTGGTLRRMLVAPVPPWAVLVGKLGASVALGVGSLTVLIVASTVLLGARWGAVGPVAALVVVGALSAVAVTALVATLARTVEQADGWTSLVAIVFGALGGSFFSLEAAPPVLDVVSHLTPHRWLIEGFRSSGAGAGLGGVSRSLLALTAFVVVIGGLAVARARQVVDGS
jgi:ABC-2 type transport system permease protein